MFRIEYAENSMKITSITLSENRHVLTMIAYWYMFDIIG